MRYQFYREHKYVSAALNDVERLFARTDFRNLEEVNKAKSAFMDLADMLRGHAEYENEKLHPLLKKKQSPICAHIEEDHAHQEEHLQEIQSMLEEVEQAPDRVAFGYKVYLTYRKFVADNLLHLYEEETQILPELQRLYSDEELRAVERETYTLLSPEEITEMLKILFPHMNPSDHAAFLSDIQQLVPEKFSLIDSHSL